MIYLTRRETFCSSHRLFNPQLSEEENSKIYGKCANPNGHGHNYILETTVRGKIDPKTGYLLDLAKLKEIIRKKIIEKLDHKNLNQDVDFLSGKIPTSEILTIAIWNELARSLPSGELYSIKIYETENNYFEYKGE